MSILEGIAAELLQDLPDADPVGENDLLPIGQGPTALRKAKIKDVRAALLGGASNMATATAAAYTAAGYATEQGQAAETAASQLNVALGQVESATLGANNAAALANDRAGQAEAQAAAAEQAADAANSGAGAANAAASSATAAAGNADAKATLANQKAALADAAATSANAAAGDANTAAGDAGAAAIAANDAAASVNDALGDVTAATAAATSAASNANAKATLADNAAAAAIAAAADAQDVADTIDAALAGKQDALTGVADVPGLVTALAGKVGTAQLAANEVADRNRTNHTGTQAISTVSGLQAALDAKAKATSVNIDNHGAAGDGVATDDAALVLACAAAGIGGTVEFTPNKTYKLSSVTLPDDITLDLRGATLLGSTNNILLTAGDRVAIRNGIIDCGNTKGASTVNSNAAIYGIFADGKEGLVVQGVTFLRYRNGVTIVSSVAGVKCRNWIVDGCRFIGYDWSSTTPDSLQVGVYCGATSLPANTVIGTFDDDWEAALDVCCGRLTNNYVFGGQYGFGIHKASNVTVTGNTITETSRGISVQHQTRDIVIVGNVLSDNHSTSIQLASGVRNFTVMGNVCTGVHANDNAGIQAYYGCRDGVIVGNVVDSRFDQWDGGSFNDARAPSVGIRTGQMASNITIANNKLRGFQVAIYVVTSIYPSISPTDPNYQNCGVRNIRVIGNDIDFDYAQAIANPPKNQFLQSNAYGVFVLKQGAWEDATAGAWGLDGVEVSGNRIRNTNYPVAWQYTADTSGNPVAKTGLRSRDNRASSTIGASAAVFSGSMTTRDIDGIGDSWPDTGFQQWTTFTPTFTSLAVVLGGGAVTYEGKYRRNGNEVDFVIEVIPSGGATTASTSGVTTATVAGLTPQDRSICFAVDANTNANLGIGSINLSTSPVILPAWSARTGRIVITGKIRV